MSEKKYFIFTDADLDGSGSYLTWKWCTGKSAEYKTCRVNDTGTAIKSWLVNNSFDDYERVYVFDLDISQDEEAVSLLDRSNVTIVDHHKTHVRNKDIYKHARTIIQEYTSCTKLLYEMFKKAGKTDHLTPQQKLLVLMIDDYDCYELKVPHSYDLNIVLWSYKGHRLQKFVSDFGNGFSGFTSFHQNMIDFNYKKIARLKRECKVHQAVIPIGDTSYKFVSTFADSCINEMADYILDTHEGDVGLVVNMKTKKVSFRKNKKVKINLGKLANRLTDGGGHEYAAGGKLNENFLRFTKVFQPID